MNKSYKIIEILDIFYIKLWWSSYQSSAGRGTNPVPGRDGTIKLKIERDGTGWDHISVPPILYKQNWDWNWVCIFIAVLRYLSIVTHIHSKKNRFFTEPKKGSYPRYTVRSFFGFVKVRFRINPLHENSKKGFRSNGFVQNLLEIIQKKVSYPTKVPLKISFNPLLPPAVCTLFEYFSKPEYGIRQMNQK